MGRSTFFFLNTETVLRLKSKIFKNIKNCKKKYKKSFVFFFSNYFLVNKRSWILSITKKNGHLHFYYFSHNTWHYKSKAKILPLSVG